MRKIFVVEYHDQVLELWRAEAISSKQVLHLDFHCDLRGLLINRRTQRAHRVWDRFPGVDEGNFLTHAILEGAISGVRWVHDEPGGRQYDLKTVKYESDLTAFFYRYLIAKRKEQGVPIHYEVIPNSEWTGLNPGELLDIDWDFFASKEYAVESIGQRVEAFFSREFPHVPEQTYVCYSPDYSHPTREVFRRFVTDLAALFQADVVNVPASPRVPERKTLHKSSVLLPLLRVARQVYHRGGLALRKRGIY